LTDVSYLPDVNVLLALSDREHVGYELASKWFNGIGDARFILCPITEAGFIRIASMPQLGKRELKDAIALSREMTRLPGYCYWPITDTWLSLVQPFASRLHGYKQVTDAYLLGLAIKGNAVLVTLDHHIEAVADVQFSRNLLTLR
jgi:hypothetical protein